MAKATVVSVGATPSESVVNDAKKVLEATDSLGRRIVVQRPNALTSYRIMKMLGGENARNEVVIGYAMLACSVVSINGEPIMMPNSERQIEAMIDRLGDEGMAAIADCFAANPVVTTGKEEAKN